MELLVILYKSIRYPCMLFPIFTSYILRHLVACFQIQIEKLLSESPTKNTPSSKTTTGPRRIIDTLHWPRSNLHLSESNASESRLDEPFPTSRSTDAWVRIRDCRLKPPNFQMVYYAALLGKWGFLGGTSGKQTNKQTPPVNAGDVRDRDSVLRLGRFPWRRA